MYIVEFFEYDNKSHPIEDFMNSLDGRMRAKAVSMMELLQEKGPELRKPYTDALGDGIFELRVIQSGNITRWLFFYDKNIIIITNGFVKKTQKTPPSEIAISKKRRSYYLGKNNN